VEINGQPGSGRKVLKHHPKVGSGTGGGSAKNEGVIRVLENRTGGIVSNGVGQGPALPGLANQVLQDIGHKDKDIRGEGVPLTEAIFTADPIAGDTV
jgi:hypothetical protein